MTVTAVSLRAFNSRVSGARVQDPAALLSEVAGMLPPPSRALVSVVYNKPTRLRFRYSSSSFYHLHVSSSKSRRLWLRITSIFVFVFGRLLLLTSHALTHLPYIRSTPNAYTLVHEPSRARILIVPFKLFNTDELYF